MDGIDANILECGDPRLRDRFQSADMSVHSKAMPDWSGNDEMDRIDANILECGDPAAAACRCRLGFLCVLASCHGESAT